MATSSTNPNQPTQTPFKFQLLSDLHLEGRRDPIGYDYLINRQAEYLLLPGDIGRIGQTTHHVLFQNWLLKQTTQFKKLFIIAGNHEYKGNTIAVGNNMLQSWAMDGRFKNKLVVLENSKYDMMTADHSDKEITILGCTLWTKVWRSQATASSNDWTTSPGIVGDSRLEHNKRFDVSLQWIKNEVEKIRTDTKHNPNRRILVMTHHAPSLVGTSNPQFATGNRWSGYQNDILGGEGVAGLQIGDVWVHGHTHWSHSQVQDNVRLISNQRGYLSDEKNQFDYDPWNSKRYNKDFTFIM